MGSITPGLVCAHHHLYSGLARGMPAPPSAPHDFLSVLQQIWWRLDAAMDLDMLAAAARLCAAEAAMSGTTAIIDHHESPMAIEGSLSVLAQACNEIGVRYVGAYGVTDRWSDGVMSNGDDRPTAMTNEARKGLEECRRFAAECAGGDTDMASAMVGIHAAFTCADETIEAAAGLADDLGVGVHVHVAEGPDDRDAAKRLRRWANDRWLLVHCVFLEAELPGTIAHNPRSNMNNSVGYANPARFANRIVLGTDGIGGDMAEEFRLAFAAHRQADLSASPDVAWSWLEAGRDLVPAARADRVTWAYPEADQAWHMAYSPGVRPTDVWVGDRQVVADGSLVSADIAEIRAKAGEQAQRLFALL